MLNFEKYREKPVFEKRIAIQYRAFEYRDILVSRYRYISPALVNSMVDSMVVSMVDSMVRPMVGSLVDSMVHSMVGFLVDSIVRWNDVGLFNSFRICTLSYQQMKNSKWGSKLKHGQSLYGA